MDATSRGALYTCVLEMTEHETEHADETPLPLSKESLATLTEIAARWADGLALDLHAFSRHGKRSTVGPEDVRLVARKSNRLAAALAAYEATLPAARAPGPAQGKKRPRAGAAAGAGASSSSAAGAAATEPRVLSKRPAKARGSTHNLIMGMGSDSSDSDDSDGGGRPAAAAMRHDAVMSDADEGYGPPSSQDQEPPPVFDVDEAAAEEDY